jgi:modulator of FtsH protease
MVDAEWSSWVNFYGAAAGAAAALTGLVFVALSINLSRVLAMPGMSARAGEGVALLGLALLVSLQSLIPRQSLAALGWEIGPAALAAWTLPLLLQWHSLRNGHFQRYFHLIVRAGLHQASTVPILIASYLLMNSHADARYWLAYGILLTLVAGMLSAWVLLVEIIR